MSNRKPAGSGAGERVRKGGRASPVLTRFSFVNSYSVVDKDENPLITGELDDVEAGGEHHEENQQQMLHIDLHDLVKAKKSFEMENKAGGTGPDAELTLQEFVQSFGEQVGKDQKEQLGYLFMKIDCNCDGRVSWDELLTYVMSQDRNRNKPDALDSQIVRADIPDCPNEEAHRDSAQCSLYASKCNCYVTGGRDGTLRVWSTSLRMQLSLPVSTHKPMVAVNSMVCLPGNLNKLVVASADRMLSIYELQDLAGSRRWSTWGRVQLKDMPVSLAAFIHVADQSHCLAIGTDAGSVPILDAKKLLSLLKEERVRDEAGKGGGIPFKHVQTAVILTLPLHVDWVCHLAYLDSAAALVSGSLDTLLMVTQLDWPPKAVPTNNRHDVSMLKADPNHCRSMCCIPAHHKGVLYFQLMNVSSRKLCATCSYERDARIWNIETGDLVRTLIGHRSLLRMLAFDESTKVLVTLAVDGEMRTWEMISYSQLQIIRPPNYVDRVSSVHFSPVQQCLVTTNKRLQLWQHPRKTATQEVLNASLLAPQGHRNPLVRVLYSHHFFLLISGDESGLICVWDVRTGRLAFRFEHGSRLTAMHLDGSGRKLITGGVNGDVAMWNFSSGEKLKTISSLEAPKTEVTALLHIVLPKLAYFVSVGWSRDVWMWPDRREERGQAHPRRLAGHTDDIMCIAFCPPNLLYSGGYDGTLLVHNIESGAVHKRVQPSRRRQSSQEGEEHTGTGSGPADFARSVAIEALGIIDANRQVLPDCALVCGTADGYLSLYSASGMQMLDEASACDPGEGIQTLCVEDSATFVVTGDTSGRVKVWDITHVSMRWPSERDFRLLNVSSNQSLPSQGAMRLLYSWRAHAKGICHVEYLVGVEGIVTGSTDCTVRMWTLSGEQVGVFGQTDVWKLAVRGTWFDDTCIALGNASDDKVAASEKKLRTLMQKEPPRHVPQPQQQPAAKPKLLRGMTGLTSKAAQEKAGFYRLQAPQIEELSRLSDLLKEKEVRKVEIPPSAQELLASLPPVKSFGDGRPAGVLNLKRASSQGSVSLSEANSAIYAAFSKRAMQWRPQSGYGNPTAPDRSQAEIAGAAAFMGVMFSVGSVVRS